MISAAPSTRTTSQEFMTSLRRLPVQASPSHLVSRPSAVNTGSSTGFAGPGPDARISSWPSSAGWRVPDTGASTTYTSGRSWPARAASSSVAVTPTVLICAHTDCGRSAPSIPAPKASWFTASASATMVITTSTSRTASGASSWAVAPSAASAAAFSGVRSHTSTVNPLRSRLRVIPRPIVPEPSTATLGSGRAAPAELMCSSPRWFSLRRLLVFIFNPQRSGAAAGRRAGLAQLRQRDQPGHHRPGQRRS